MIQAMRAHKSAKFHGGTKHALPKPTWPLIELSVTNIANQIAEVVPSNPLDSASDRVLQPITDFAGYPLPGRTFTLSLRWHPGGRT